MQIFLYMSEKVASMSVCIYADFYTKFVKNNK